MKTERFRDSAAARIMLAALAAGVAAAVSLAHIHAQAPQLNRGVPADNELHVLAVQGNVSMIVGDGANIAISVGSDGGTARR